MHKYVPALLTAATFFVSAATVAQQRPALTAEDYARAERFMGYNTQALVDHSPSQPNWLAGDRFWYRVLTAQGSEFILVDPARKTRTPAFDQAKLAAALSAASGKTYEATRLPFRTLTFSPDEKTISFAASGKSWKYDLGSGQLSPDATPAAKPSPNAENEIESPDGQLAAYIKDYNLWVRDTKTNQTTQLTTDGAKDYGYATDNAGWTTQRQAGAELVARLAQNRHLPARPAQGGRYVPGNHQRRPSHPESVEIPAARRQGHHHHRAGDYRREPGKVVRLQMPPDQHRGSLRTIFRAAAPSTTWTGAPTAGQLAFVSTSRDHKQENLRVADAATGAVRDVFEKPWPRSTSRARAPSTGATCPRPTKLSGTRSATTGATSTCTMPAAAR